jgi:hypothetical protein
MNEPIESPKTNQLAIWLFNPFMYIAGWQAFLIGLIGILAAGLIGSVGNVHFDGVLDLHIGAKVPLWFYIAEGFMDWLSLAILLLLASLILRGTSFRVIDIFGTQTLARWPMLISAAVGILPANQRVAETLVKMIQNPTQPPTFPIADTAVFAAAMIIVLVMTAWMVVLMYRAYAVSCNLKGAKAIVSFIVCLIIAELISKAGIITTAKLVLLN